MENLNLIKQLIKPGTAKELESIAYTNKELHAFLAKHGVEFSTLSQMGRMLKSLGFYPEKKRVNKKQITLYWVQILEKVNTHD